MFISREEEDWVGVYRPVANNCDVTMINFILAWASLRCDVSMKLLKIFFVLFLCVWLFATEGCKKCFALSPCSVRARFVSLETKKGFSKCVCINRFYGKNCRFKGKLFVCFLCSFWLLSETWTYQRNKIFDLEQFIPRKN